MPDKLLLGFVLFSLASIGLVSANAEEFTVEVPFEYGDNGCTEFKDGEWKLYQCYMEETRFNGTDNNPNHLSTETDDGCLDGYDRDVTTNECKLPSVIEAEAWQECYDDPNCPVGIFIKDGIVTNNQEIIDDIDGINTSFYSEGIIYCGYDIDLYQTNDKFEIPTVEYTDENGNPAIRLDKNSDMKSINLANYPDEKERRMAVEACLGQTTLEKQQKFGGVGSITAVPNSEDYFPHHSEVAFGIPPISQAMVNADANKGFTNTSVENLICNGFYSQLTKLYFGCDPETGYVTTLPTPTMNDAFNAKMQKEINTFNNDDGYKMSQDLFHEKSVEALQRQLANQNLRDES